MNMVFSFGYLVNKEKELHNLQGSTSKKQYILASAVKIKKKSHLNCQFTYSNPFSPCEAKLLLVSVVSEKKKKTNFKILSRRVFISS